jgi:hypothetical protein
MTKKSAPSRGGFFLFSFSLLVNEVFNLDTRTHCGADGD